MEQERTDEGRTKLKLWLVAGAVLLVWWLLRSRNVAAPAAAPMPDFRSWVPVR